MPFRWILDEGQPSSHCLDTLDFDSWLDFAFKHPVPKKGQDRWYNLDAFESYYYKDAPLVLERLAALFLAPELLLDRYSPGQIEQGLWGIMAAFELPDLLEDPKLGLEDRLHCVKSLPVAYDRLLWRQGLEKVAFRYWDPLTHMFSDAEARTTRPDLLRIHDGMFESLAAILHQKPVICFLGAARGLAKLHHEHGADAITAALASRNDLSIFEHAYGLSCSRGDMESLVPPDLD
jgi:hypothetical protein